MGGNSTTTTQSTSPWASQQPYILNAFNQASTDYTNAMATGPYGGDYVATGTPQQYAQIADALGFDNGTGLGATNSVINNGQSLFNTGTGETSAAALGLAGLSGDNTPQIVNDANTVASGFNVPGAVDAAMQQANLEAADSTLPSLYRNASATGNLNADRTAISQGVVQGQLANTAADLTANLENQEYQTGLNTALTGNQESLSALGTLGSLGTGDTLQGDNALSTGVADGLGLNTSALTAANETQTLNQSALTNAVDQYTGNINFPWTQLSNLYNIVGSTNWGSQSTQTQQQNPSLLSTLGSAFGLFGTLI